MWTVPIRNCENIGMTKVMLLYIRKFPNVFVSRIVHTNIYCILHKHVYFPTINEICACFCKVSHGQKWKKAKFQKDQKHYEIFDLLVWKFLNPEFEGLKISVTHLQNKWFLKNGPFILYFYEKSNI